MKMTFTKIAAVLGLVALAACSGGTEQTTSLLAETQELNKIIKAKRSGPAPLPDLTRAQLNDIPVPLLELKVASLGVAAWIVPHVRRKDAGPGPVTAWKSPDGAQVVLRSGVLIGTRGIGNDVASADASLAVRATQDRKAASGARSLQVRNDNNGLLRIDMQCSIRVVGSETLTIVQQNFATTHMRETCNTPYGQQSNDYWIDSRTGGIVQSRQWAGPYLGYFDTRLLKS